MSYFVTLYRLQCIYLLRVLRAWSFGLGRSHTHSCARNRTGMHARSCAHVRAHECMGTLTHTCAHTCTCVGKGMLSVVQVPLEVALLLKIMF
jgi:hypothetical protein